MQEVYVMDETETAVVRVTKRTLGLGTLRVQALYLQ